MKKRQRILATILTITLLGLAGCSSDTQADTSESEEQETAAESVTVAVANNSKPNSYTDESGELTGYEVEILRAIDEAVPEYEFQIEAVSQSAEEIGIDTGKYALIAQGFYKTEEREEKYLIPEENTGVSLMKIFTLEENTDINTLADLQDKKLAPVPPNGGVYNCIASYNEENPDAAIEFETAENVPIANRFQEMLDGKYDAVVWPSANIDLEEIEESLGETFRASDPVQINPTYFLIEKSQEDFYEKVDQAIKDLKEDGTLTELSEKYFGEDIFEYQ